MSTAVSEPTPDQIMTAIASALEARDFPAVVALMKMLAVRDPASAQLIYDVIMLGSAS